MKLRTHPSIARAPDERDRKIARVAGESVIDCGETGKSGDPGSKALTH
jgi:hypothetical protein